jgi:hypothetical protein
VFDPPQSAAVDRFLRAEGQGRRPRPADWLNVLAPNNRAPVQRHEAVSNLVIRARDGTGSFAGGWDTQLRAHWLRADHNAPKPRLITTFERPAAAGAPPGCRLLQQGDQKEPRGRSSRRWLRGPQAATRSQLRASAADLPRIGQGARSSLRLTVRPQLRFSARRLPAALNVVPEHDAAAAGRLRFDEGERPSALHAGEQRSPAAEQQRVHDQPQLIEQVRVE